MTTIRLGGSDFPLRLAVHEPWEALSAAALLARYRLNPPWPYRPWASSLLPRLQRSPGVLAWLSELSTLPMPALPVDARGGPSWWPSRVDGGARTDDLRGELRGRTSMETSALHLFWRIAIAPHWSFISSVLDDELTERSRILATRGAIPVLRSLPGQLRVLEHALILPQPDDREIRLQAGGILLIPSLFPPLAPTVGLDQLGTTLVPYQISGVALIADHEAMSRKPSHRGRPPLAHLIGDTKVTVIRALTGGGTTGSLAQRLRLAPSTVSSHLQTLRASGVVTSERKGKEVIYRLTARGRALLELFDHKSDA